MARQRRVRNMPDGEENEVKEPTHYSSAIPGIALQPGIPVPIWTYMFPAEGIVSGMTFFLEKVVPENYQLRLEISVNGEFAKTVPVAEGENRWSEIDLQPVNRFDKVAVTIMSVNGGARLSGAFVMFEFHAG